MNMKKVFFILLIVFVMSCTKEDYAISEVQNGTRSFSYSFTNQELDSLLLNEFGAVDFSIEEKMIYITKNLSYFTGDRLSTAGRVSEVSGEFTHILCNALVADPVIGHWEGVASYGTVDEYVTAGNSTQNRVNGEYAAYAVIYGCNGRIDENAVGTTFSCNDIPITLRSKMAGPAVLSCETENIATSTARWIYGSKYTKALLKCD